MGTAAGERLALDRWLVAAPRSGDIVRHTLEHIEAFRRALAEAGYVVEERA